MKLLLYCTKAKPVLKVCTANCSDCYIYTGNGKIVAECDYEVEEIEDRVSYFDSWFNEGHHTKTMRAKELITKSCLDHTQLTEYLGEGDPNEVLGYAIHIKNLHIFDEPKELSDYHISYYNKELEMMREKHLEKAPQNMCRAFDVNGNYIVISIRPEWLCKILNGEKTIEVRRKVLKEMLK